jgi:Predicted hydrolases or acyltransferases (alpha/beta hydrolase superfamily)
MAAEGRSDGQTVRRNFQGSDGVRLSFLEAGVEHAAEETTTIAFITGWSMPASLWQKQLAELSPSFYALALDPRGQGESEVPTFGYTAERRATDIHEFLKPFSKVILVGWSLGAIESLQYIQMFGTDRLAGLVLVDSSVGEEPAPGPGGEGGFLKELRKDRDKALTGFIHAIFKTKRSNADLDELVRGAQRLALNDSIALLSYPFPRTHWREITHGFTKPLLYVVTPQFEAQAHNLQKNRPGTQIEVFRSAGHALFVDEPERFNRLIEKFAKGLP